MSLKYQRVKKRDLSLPAPLRWLTRTFSSITLAVILLSLIIVYGTVASVPLGFLAYSLCLLIAGVIPLALGVWCVRRIKLSRQTANLGILLFAVGTSVGAVILTQQQLSQMAWFTPYRALVLYRLPQLEMTELEFYSWWPMKLILGLFILNMIWATLRRIEFNFLNIGVLTVHAGIVTIAVASLFYGKFKIEGDILLWRKDLGGTFQNTFYDRTEPAIYFSKADMNLMLPLPQLPRYNDYPPDHSTKTSTQTPASKHHFSLNLHEQPEFKEVLGNKLKATLSGFLAYAQLQPDWINAPQGHINPALRISVTQGEKGPTLQQKTLVGAVPSLRVIEQKTWAVELLTHPGSQRLKDLQASFQGIHGLIVRIPSKNFHKVYAIHEGQTITLDNTGYRLDIERLGPYGMSIVTPGYRGASDTRAMIRIHDGQKRTFRRLVMHRYPKLTQDFVPVPNDPNVGPMGKRQPPSQDIQLTYLDRSKSQFWIIWNDPKNQDLVLAACLPGQKPLSVPFSHDRFPVVISGQNSLWLKIEKFLPRAHRTVVPVITPKAQRKPKEEGTYLQALLPIDLQMDLPGQDHPWRKRVWLAHMQYPNPQYADGYHRPVTVNVPTLGPIRLCFSRKRVMLPFKIRLDNFKMVHYPGSNIPKDFISDLTVMQPDGTLRQEQVHLNNPLLYRGIKLSQTGWDPGNPRDPKNQQRNAAGQFIHQQRYTILGVGNNVAIHFIFLGACLIVAGIPWAFYVKPMLVQRQKRLIQQQLASSRGTSTPHTTKPNDPTEPTEDSHADPAGDTT